MAYDEITAPLELGLQVGPRDWRRRKVIRRLGEAIDHQQGESRDLGLGSWKPRHTNLLVREKRE